MAHVFIVNEETLDIHLKYMFAGIGSKELSCDFLENEDNAENEVMLVSMVADISRVRENDDIIFYLQQTTNGEGRFFGSFKVAGKPFLCDGSYLKEELGKKLIYRVPIKKDEVYSKGITERECLDSLEGINHPSELCWSLIYRKLTGNRGCTAITDYEYKQIMEKIRRKNNYQSLDGNYFRYNKNNNIITISNDFQPYTGKMQSLNVEKRLIYKASKNQSYEAHLQTYVIQNYNNIEEIFVKNLKICWIGNEVHCGVGMQSIDVVFAQEDNKNVYIYLCELKDEEIYKNIFIGNQIEKYIFWMKDYIVPTYNKKVILCPIIICKKISGRARKTTRIKNNNLYKQLSDKFTYQTSDKFDINKIQFIEFEIGKENVNFERKNTNEI